MQKEYVIRSKMREKKGEGGRGWGGGRRCGKEKYHVSLTCYSGIWRLKNLLIFVKMSHITFKMLPFGDAGFHFESPEDLPFWKEGKAVSTSDRGVNVFYYLDFKWSSIQSVTESEISGNIGVFIGVDVRNMTPYSVAEASCGPTYIFNITLDVGNHIYYILSLAINKLINLINIVIATGFNIVRFSDSLNSEWHYI